MYKYISGVIRARGKRMYSALRNRVGSKLGFSSSSLYCTATINHALGQHAAATSSANPQYFAGYTPTWRTLRSRKVGVFCSENYFSTLQNKFRLIGPNKFLLKLNHTVVK